MDTQSPGLLITLVPPVFRGTALSLQDLRVALPYMQPIHIGILQLAKRFGMTFCVANCCNLPNGRCPRRMCHLSNSCCGSENSSSSLFVGIGTL